MRNKIETSFPPLARGRKQIRSVVDFRRVVRGESLGVESVSNHLLLLLCAAFPRVQQSTTCSLAGNCHVEALFPYQEESKIIWPDLFAVTRKFHFGQDAMPH